MEIKSISITNFKGIRNAKINFAKCPNANVFTLVGPNECGKTTVLEAIHSIKSDMDNQAVLIGVDDKKSPNGNVPISQRGSFTGNIKVSVDLSLSQAECRSISEAFHNKFSHNLVIQKPIDTLVYEIADKFEAGDHKESSEHWSIDDFKVESIVQSVEQSPTQPTSEGTGSVTDPSQLEASNLLATSKNALRNLSDAEEGYLYNEVLKPRLPKILYFPNLLSRFPEKIYLDQADNPDVAQREMNIFYTPIPKRAENLGLT